MGGGCLVLGGVLCEGMCCVGWNVLPRLLLSFMELLYVSCGCQQYQGNVYLRRKAQMGIDIGLIEGKERTDQEQGPN